MDEINLNPVQQDSNPAPSPVEQEPAKKIGRFKASRIIAKESWALLKKDKEIMLFPILSALTSLILIAIAGLVIFFLILSGNIKNLEQADQGNYTLNVVIVFVMYFLTAFITLFFETGIITVVRGRLSGQNLTFSDGLSNSFRKAGKIARWSLVAATVGVILKMISERSGILGRIVIAILGAAWSILTFFIAPILIAEDLTIKESLQKSAGIIKKVWGETVIVNVGVGLFFALLIFLGIFVFIATLFTGNVHIITAAFILLILYFVILAVISSTLSVVYQVVLYEYANTGVAPQGFSQEVIGLAFKQQKKKGIIGIGGM
jgi:hypothetical protein